jgi:hypothetical protein
MLALGWVKPLWRWIQRNRASSWPAATGQIESVSVTASHPPLRDTILPGRSEGSSLGNDPGGFHRCDHLEPELLAIKSICERLQRETPRATAG